MLIQPKLACQLHQFLKTVAIVVHLLVTSHLEKSNSIKPYGLETLVDAEGMQADQVGGRGESLVMTASLVPILLLRTVHSAVYNL